MFFKNIVLFFIINACLTISIVLGEEKTFPGAEVIIPAVLPVVLPAIISTVLPIILPHPNPHPSRPQFSMPPISVSHSGSIAATVGNKPMAISHSGSFTNSNSAGHTAAGSHAIASTGSNTQSSSSSSTSHGNRLPNIFQLPRRWNKILFGL